MRALTIDSAYLLGTAAPTLSSNPEAELNAINTLVNLYNNGALAPTTIGGITFDVGPGSNVPPPVLPTATGISGDQVNLSQVSSTVNLGAGNLYLLSKVGQNFGVYYIGGLTGTHTLTNDVFVNDNGSPKDVSHYSLYTAGTTSVPDGGLTALLLGGGLLILGLFRRRLF